MSAADNLGGCGLPTGPRLVCDDPEIAGLPDASKVPSLLGRMPWPIKPGQQAPEPQPTMLDAWTFSEEVEYRRINGIRENLQRRRDVVVMQLAQALQMQPAAVGVAMIIRNATAIRKALEPFDETARR